VIADGESEVQAVEEFPSGHFRPPAGLEMRRTVEGSSGPRGRSLIRSHCSGDAIGYAALFQSLWF
jgi:hypothetical protein